MADGKRSPLLKGKGGMISLSRKRNDEGLY